MFEDRRTSDLLPSLTAAVAWGAMFPIAAVAIQHVDAFHLTAIRYLVATLIFLGLLAAIEGRAAFKTEGRGVELFILGTLGFAGFNLLTYLALEHTRPQDASLIVATAPLLTALGALADHSRQARRAPRRRDGRRAASASTLVITRGDPATLIGGDGRAGDLLVLAGVASFVAYTLGARRFTEFSPLRYTALSATGGTLTILAVTAVRHAQPAPTRCRASHDCRRVWCADRLHHPRRRRASACSPGTRACAGSAPPTARSS